MCVVLVMPLIQIVNGSVWLEEQVRLVQNQVGILAKGLLFLSCFRKFGCFLSCAIGSIKVRAVVGVYVMLMDKIFAETN